MPIRISELRLSFVWVQAFPGDSQSLLGDQVKYLEEFGKASSGPRPWTLPWPKNQKQHFWQYYLETGRLETLGGKQAWRHLMPLRVPQLVKIEAPPPGRRIVVEGLCYPHSVAAAATVFIKRDLSLDQMVDEALKARSDHYKATLPKAGITVQLSLDQLASRILDLLYEAVLGQGATAQEPLDKPFTIATFINGQGVDLTQPCQPNDSIHRALEGVCTWNQFWRQSPLHPLDASTSLKFRDKDYMLPSHLLYGLERGRAVWFPGYFKDQTTAPEKIRTLGCYHHNLTNLSLQTESLIALMQRAEYFINQGQHLPSFLVGPSTYAAGALGRLYVGAKGSYRSWSSRAQIERSKTAVNKVRVLLGQPPL